MEKKIKKNRRIIILAVIVFVIIGCAILFGGQTGQTKSSLPKNYLFFKYNGLPYVFWLLLGMGLMFGLTFHGFKLFSINIERRGKE